MISMTAHCPFMRFSSGRRLKRGLRRLEKSAEFMDQECRRSADPDVSKVGRRHRVQPARSGHLSGRVPQIDHDDGHHEVLENGGEHGSLEEVARDFDLECDEKCRPSLLASTCRANLAIQRLHESRQKFVRITHNLLTKIFSA